MKDVLNHMTRAILKYNLWMDTSTVEYFVTVSQERQTKYWLNGAFHLTESFCCNKLL